MTDWLLTWPWPERLRSGRRPDSPESSDLKSDHLIIAGYGPTGRHLSRAASAASIPYLIIEMNPDTVKRERERGEKIIFGDASQESLLKQGRIASARVMAIAITDPGATRRIIKIAKELNPRLRLIVRARFVTEAESLLRLGADEVIPEEHEAAIALLPRILKAYAVPPEVLNQIAFLAPRHESSRNGRPPQIE